MSMKEKLSIKEAAIHSTESIVPANPNIVTHHQYHRRLAAVSFLNNISLNGSYKDSRWTQSHKSGYYENGPVDVVDHDHVPIDGFNTKSHTYSSTYKCGTLSHQNIAKQKVEEEAEDDICIGADSDDTRVKAEDVIEKSECQIGVRSNTASFIKVSNVPSEHRRAHFNSSESLLDHGVVGKSSGNGADHSSISNTNREPKTTTLRNLKSDSIFPSIKNERLVILVSQRSPLVIFSALPYSRQGKGLRAMDRPTELIRRTRNTSGPRPMSILNDPPDPLEQLVNYQPEEEISYGYLLKPRKSFHDGDTTSNPNAATEIVPSTSSEHSASRSYSIEQVSPVLTTVVNVGEEPNCFEAAGDVLNPSLHEKNSSGDLLGDGIPAYSPHTLDDPEFRGGRHRTLLTFPSYITSVIDYCKASDMKKELNDKFRDRFPHIHLTLSKLKSLKREMRRVAKSECNVDLLTVAQAYVYFEKLILGSFVTKYNRKFCAGACLLISAKLNDVKGFHLHNLLDMIERTFRINRRELLSFEFAVLIALEFTLHLPTWEVFPHYQRLLYES